MKKCFVCNTGTKYQNGICKECTDERRRLIIEQTQAGRDWSMFTKMLAVCSQETFNSFHNQVKKEADRYDELTKKIESYEWQKYRERKTEQTAKD